MEDADKTFDADEVQICKPYSAVNERIQCFLKRKREESNNRNTRVYCSSVSSNESSRTCATIAAKRQKGSECFVKKSKVINPSGPQCNGGFDPASEKSYKLSNVINSAGSKSDVLERISNLEKCLNIEKYDHDNIDIYCKLKSIEDQVLKLENILMNVIGNHSLSKILSNYDQCTEIISQNLNTNNINPQENLITEDKSKNEKDEPAVPGVLPKKPKYSAEEIQKLINNIKNVDDKTNTF